jgi:hypothetical protein
MHVDSLAGAEKPPIFHLSHDVYFWYIFAIRNKEGQRIQDGR